MAKVLAVLSSGHNDAENNYETGWWGEELFAPMEILKKAGHEVELASPLGGKPTIDQASIGNEYDPEGKYKNMYEAGLADNTQRLSDITPEDYDAVFIVGGHGAMYDLAENETLHSIINSVYDNGKIVSAVCHGPAPLIWTKRPNGESILSGLDVTGYPEAVEPEGLPAILPFSLEGEMSKVANYTADEKVVWGNDQLVTGRDPFSSEALAEELVKALDKKK
ncbi:type 1 glutamine amidotransferase domain-containing protein [Planococcus halotolerans]|uniref:Type 1 glutamine amidotransferase domain-containing protein n=1 Tax=Planococcus halotolerans TaxID=2233542 RepID=A0A365KWZ0_9BACL|nr:type 1 glutamine amidotransferase domain-containing protein [Planococcus halotolerans]QHJ72284.1 type 1 glutamine amidotransferase domain-containing protein [Planococcus halotolerans]RAZ77695.1 type 1 glutamine amidotransferase domain-containing protein [Planococcus halotolerans]